MKKPATSRKKAISPRRIAFLIYPNCHILDLCGPLYAFHFANRALANLGRIEERGYECITLAASSNPVPTWCGLDVIPTHSYKEIKGNFDTVIVIGGEGCEQSCKDDGMVGWICATAPRARRIASVCTGAFILAEAGLLDGRRVTTHWIYAELLSKKYPSVKVDARLIFERDGNIYTSGGVTSGIDMALALIEEDLGKEIALATARTMVAFPHRRAGQSQFSGYFTLIKPLRAEIGELQIWIQAHLDADLSIAALAARTQMSPRNLSRLFRSETGESPAHFVEKARADAARCKLEMTGNAIGNIAAECGFKNIERMRRTFQRLFGANPADYRAWFRIDSTTQG
jgi:transcriptional regulator GlxA family with amidase domain